MRKRALRWTVIVGIAVIGAVLLGVGAGPRALPGASAAGPLGPLSAFALPGGEQMRFEGRVVERLDAGSYTYLLIEQAGGARRWVVTLASSRGARSRAAAVQIVAVGYAEQFISKRLGRTFDGLYFAVVRPA